LCAGAHAFEAFVDLVERPEPRARDGKLLAEGVDLFVCLMQRILAGRQRGFDLRLTLGRRGLAAPKPYHPSLELSALLSELDLVCRERL